MRLILLAAPPRNCGFDSVGDESYKCFTMPDLYHVVNGIELFSPKFNVVPPGVNENYYLRKDRLQSDRGVEEMLLHGRLRPDGLVSMIPTSDNLFDGASRPDQNLTGLNALARARHCKKTI